MKRNYVLSKGTRGYRFFIISVIAYAIIYLLYYMIIGMIISQFDAHSLITNDPVIALIDSIETTKSFVILILFLTNIPYFIQLGRKRFEFKQKDSIPEIYDIKVFAQKRRGMRQITARNEKTKKIEDINVFDNNVFGKLEKHNKAIVISKNGKKTISYC